MTKYFSQVPTPEWIQVQRELLTKTIDYDALIQQGVLEKRGAWYLVKDMNALPEHARAQMLSARTSKNGVEVKFG